VLSADALSADDEVPLMRALAGALSYMMCGSS
jgi:hypothetical protein